jgi:molybdopterin-binding protein
MVSTRHLHVEIKSELVSFVTTRTAEELGITSGQCKLTIMHYCTRYHK